MVDTLRQRLLSLATMVLVLYVIFSTITSPPPKSKPQSSENQVTPNNYSRIFMDFFIGYQNYIGTWSSKSTRWLTQRSGKAYFAVKYTKPFLFRLLIFDGVYETDTSYALFTDVGIDDSNMLTNWEGELKFIERHDRDPRECGSVLNLNYNQTSKEIEGKISSKNCYFQLDFSLGEYTYEMERNPKIYYSIFSSLLSLVIILAFVRHIYTCNHNAQIAQRTSILTIGMNGTIDCFLSLWNLDAGFKTWPGFDYMIIAAFWTAGLFIFVDIKLAVSVWKAQHPEIFDFGISIARRFSTNFQKRYFLLVLFANIVLISSHNLYYITIPVMHFIFLPQIIKNAFNGYKETISPWICTVVLLARLVFVSYFLLCPKNFVSYAPDTLVAIVTIFVCLSQIIVIWLQKSMPSFILPERYRPNIYNYFEDVKPGLAEESDCTICMSSISTDAEDNGTPEHVRHMRAPCGHRFHEECLIRWMSVKMECPTCRSTLPEINT